MKVEEIEIDRIIVPKDRARSTFTEEQHEELKTSIQKHGFTVPILVKKLKDDKYELIDGEHRLSIMCELERKTIPAVIVEADSRKATLLNILANTARGSQNPMDVAEALLRAYNSGATVAELAAATGHTEDWVRNYLTLTELPEKFKEALRTGALKASHVFTAMMLDDEREVYSALDSVLAHNWTVSVLKYYVDQRAAEIERMHSAGKNGFIEAPPTPQYARELISYGDCSACKRKVNRNDLFMPTICVDCRTLLEYLCSQLGDPKEAMQTIYNALQLYFDVTRRERRGAEQYTPLSSSLPPEALSQQQGGAQPHATPPPSSSEEEKIIRIIKALKEAGVL